MDEIINSESEEEQAKSKKLKEEIYDCIIRPKKEITYEKSKELIAQYGIECRKRIEKEKEEHPEYFIEIEDAIKNKDKNNKLYAIGQLGKSLENMGIEVAIDKREGENKEDSLIINQFISSGILKKNKYELHIEEDNLDKQYKIINNIDEQKKFKEEWTNNISNYVELPKDDILI